MGKQTVRERTKDSVEVTGGYSTYTHMYDLSKYKDDVTKYKGPGLVTDQYYQYILKKNPKNVGIVGTGAGRDVLIALVHGQNKFMEQNTILQFMMFS